MRATKPRHATSARTTHRACGWTARLVRVAVRSSGRQRLSRPPHAPNPPPLPAVPHQAVRGAPHRAAAIRFLEYLTSDEAQAVFAEANNEYPVVAGARLPASIAAYAAFKPDPMPVTVYGRRQAEAQAVFDQAGWR